MALSACDKISEDRKSEAENATAASTADLRTGEFDQTAVAQPKPMDILKGQWVSQSDSCSPPNGRAKSPTLTFYSENFDGDNVEGFSLFENSCTFPITGVISKSSYSGKMTCGYGEGWEGDAHLKISISETGTLQINQEPSKSSDGSEEREETGWSGTFKRCPKVLEDPEGY